MTGEILEETIVITLKRENPSISMKLYLTVKEEASIPFEILIIKSYIIGLKPLFCISFLYVLQNYIFNYQQEYPNL